MTGRAAVNGFTLIEMLVSLGLLGLVSVMIVEGLAAGTRIVAKSDARIVAGETVEAAQSLVRARLERLLPLTRFDSSQPFADLEGTADSLKFLAPPADSQGPSPPRRFRLLVSPQGDLVLASINAFASDDEPRYRRDVLLRGVRRLDISYFGPAPVTAGRYWQDSWSQRSAPPLAIRLRLVFAPGDRRRWPELIIRPAATIDTQCTLNASGRCAGRA